MISVEFHPLALEELNEARAWYEARSQRSAEEFSLAVGRATQRIEQDYQAHSVLTKNIRYVPVGKFPYVLVYGEASPGQVVVVAVAHTSRRPRYWRRRK